MAAFLGGVVAQEALCQSSRWSWSVGAWAYQNFLQTLLGRVHAAGAEDSSLTCESLG